VLPASVPGTVSHCRCRSDRKKCITGIVWVPYKGDVLEEKVFGESGKTYTHK
jgi:hypothetical protein